MVTGLKKKGVYHMYLFEFRSDGRMQCAMCVGCVAVSLGSRVDILIFEVEAVNAPDDVDDAEIRAHTYGGLIVWNGLDQLAALGISILSSHSSPLSVGRSSVTVRPIILSHPIILRL